MFENSKALSGFSVNDLESARRFYGETLGLPIEESMGLILKLASGGQVFIYPKDDHEPATYTVLNFFVTNLEQTVADLKAKGVTFEQYEMTDDDGIARNSSKGQGPDIAWFKDPAGNILSVLSEG